MILIIMVTKVKLVFRENYFSWLWIRLRKFIEKAIKHTAICKNWALILLKKPFFYVFFFLLSFSKNVLRMGNNDGLLTGGLEFDAWSEISLQSLLTRTTTSSSVSSYWWFFFKLWTPYEDASVHTWIRLTNRRMLYLASSVHAVFFISSWNSKNSIIDDLAIVISLNP